MRNILCPMLLVLSAICLSIAQGIMNHLLCTCACVCMCMCVCVCVGVLSSLCVVNPSSCVFSVGDVAHQQRPNRYQRLGTAARRSIVGYYFLDFYSRYISIYSWGSAAWLFLICKDTKKNLLRKTLPVIYNGLFYLPTCLVLYSLGRK